ncbi:MAG: glycosyltransferase family 87 protein [Chloroflexota bacterium]
MAGKIRSGQLWRGILAGLLFIGLLFWANYRFSIAEPGGTDFLYRWLPTRLVVFEGYENPYSDEVEYQVELMHHGHAHQADETPGIFAYPYYTMGVFLPLALIRDFFLARALWMTLMELAHLGIIFLVLKMLNFTPGKNLTLALILFALLPADFAQPLVDGNPSSLAALFAVLALFFTWREKDAWAGVFLALSTIKPQLVILFFALVWLWAFSSRRWRIIAFSAGSLLLLLGSSFLLQPSWLAEFIKDLTTYTGVARPSTPHAIIRYWLPETAAAAIAIILSLFSLFVILRMVKFYYGKDFSHLFVVAGLIFVLMPLSGITSAKSNYVGMFPSVLLLLWFGVKKMKISENRFAVFLLVWIVLSWVFFVAGQNWVVNGTLIYFVDFYPLPLLLLSIFAAIRVFRNEKLLSFYDKPGKRD